MYPKHLDEFSGEGKWRLRRIGLVLGLVFMCVGGAHGQHAREVEQWTAYVDSIGRMDAAPWVAKVLRMDWGMGDVTDISVQISEKDWLSLMESYESGRMHRESAERVFPEDALQVVEGGQMAADSVGIIWLTDPRKGGKGKMDMLVVNSTYMDWEADVYFVQDGCLLGRHHAFHKYGLEGVKGVGTGGMPVAYHNVCLESGTGVWEHVHCFFTAENQDLVPMGWVFKEVNLANPIVRNRNLKGKIVSLSPLTVQYDWEVEVGMRYRGPRPSFKGKSTVVYAWNAGQRCLELEFKTANMNQEKLLSFALSASDELFIHAWRKELIADLKGKNEARRLAVVEYLEYIKEYGM
jgi:hypothetical protein